VHAVISGISLEPWLRLFCEEWVRLSLADTSSLGLRPRTLPISPGLHGSVSKQQQFRGSTKSSLQCRKEKPMSRHVTGLAGMMAPTPSAEGQRMPKWRLGRPLLLGGSVCPCRWIRRRRGQGGRANPEQLRAQTAQTETRRSSRDLRTADSPESSFSRNGHRRKRVMELKASGAEVTRQGAENTRIPEEVLNAPV